MTNKHNYVLVAETDTEVRVATVSRLEQAGYDVLAAADGPQAMSLTRDHRPGLVLCDRDLPGFDGPEFCRMVKADPALRSIHVTLMIQRADAGERICCLDSGADDVLVKPLETAELLARVRAGLRFQDLQRDLAEAQHRAAVLHLAAALGHEINNPLTALFGHLELLLQHLENGDRRRMLHHIRQAGDVAGRIAEVTQRLNRLEDPKTTTYIDSIPMLDLSACPGTD